ncbi:MAG: hypothetical protein U0638_03260 [Phycisphaerales bacterium]
MITSQLLDELGTLEHRIGELRDELRARVERREELVASLASVIDGSKPVTLAGAAWRITARAYDKVAFPTMSGDPDANRRLREALTRAGVWESYSTINYSRLRVDWRKAGAGGAIRKLVNGLVKVNRSVRVKAERV